MGAIEILPLKKYHGAVSAMLKGGGGFKVVLMWEHRNFYPVFEDVSPSSQILG